MGVIGRKEKGSRIKYRVSSIEYQVARKKTSG